MGNFIHRPSWYLPESAATPESVYLNRRSFLKVMGVGSIAAVGAGCSTVESADKTDHWANSPMRDVPLPEYTQNTLFKDAGRKVTVTSPPV